MAGTKVIHCNKCGTDFATSANTVDIKCVKCGNHIKVFDLSSIKHTT